MLELTELKIKFLALHKQLINLNQYNCYYNQIDIILKLIEEIEKLSINQLKQAEEKINQIYKKILNDSDISVQFKRAFLQILKTLLNNLINLSVIKIYNQL